MALKDKSGAIIVTQSTTSYSAIRSILGMSFSHVSQAVSMTQAKQKLQRSEVDLVVVNTPAQDEFGVEGAIDLALHNRVTVILLVAPEVYDNTAYRTKSSGVFVLSKPLKGQVLLETANICITMKQRVDQLTRENDRLRRRMEEMGIVTRAKCLLIEKRGMTEPEAHRYLEKEAMDHSLTKKEVAQSIIRAEEQSA